MVSFDDFMEGSAAGADPTGVGTVMGRASGRDPSSVLYPLGDNWSPMGMGGPGKPGALGPWDVVGKGLDRANPSQDTKPMDDAAKAQGYLGGVTDAFNNVQTPALDTVNLVGPDRAADAAASKAADSSLGGYSSNPNYTGAQEAQMAALQNLAARGGRSAASDANLAAIQDEENQNARGQRGAVMQSMNARGMGGSGASLLAQLDAGQNAVTRQSQRDLGVSGQEANTALAAGQGAAGIGAGLEGQQYGEAAGKAAAQDAINRYNAGNSTAVSLANMGKNQGVNDKGAQAYNQGQMVNKVETPEMSFQNNMGLAGAKGGAQGKGLDYWSNKYKEDVGANGNMMGGLVKGGASILGALAAAHGGKTPGSPVVPGNSTLNDIVPIMSSPGEVHVPRTLAQKASPKEIGQYVKHAPTINPNPDKNKEAMLSALKNIAAKRRAA